MKTGSRKPRPRRGRIAIALFASATVLAGGAQALTPAPAMAADDLGGENCSLLWVPVDCKLVEEGGGDGGTSSGGYGYGDGGSSSGEVSSGEDPWPWEDTSEPSDTGGTGSESSSTNTGGDVNITYDGNGYDNGDDSSSNDTSTGGPTNSGAKSGDTSPFGRFRSWARRRSCRKLRGDIRGRIRYLRPDETDIDSLVNSGDEVLDNYEARWDDEGCADVLHVMW